MMKKTKMFIFSLVAMTVVGLTFLVAGPSFAFTDEIISLWTLDEGAPAGPGATYVDSFAVSDGTGNLNPDADVDGINGSQDFNGTDDGIDIGLDASYDALADDSFSIEFWVKIGTGDPAGAQVVAGRRDGAAPIDFTLWVAVLDTGRVGFLLEDTGGNGPTPAILTNASGTSVTDDIWHHVVVVRDESLGLLGGTNLIYVDGDLQASAEFDYLAGFDSATDGITIGYLSTPGTPRVPNFFFEGLIDEVAIYGRALPETEIDAHFAAGALGNSVTTIGNTPVVPPVVPPVAGGGGSSGCFINSLF